MINLTLHFNFDFHLFSSVQLPATFFFLMKTFPASEGSMRMLRNVTRPWLLWVSNANYWFPKPKYILHLAPASTAVIYILHYYLLCFSFHFTQLYSQFYRYLQILFSGGDLFERVAAPDYKLTEEKIQIFMRQIIKGNRYGCLATFCTNVFLEQSKHTS